MDEDGVGAKTRLADARVVALANRLERSLAIGVNKDRFARLVRERENMCVRFLRDFDSNVGNFLQVYLKKTRPRVG